MSKELLAYVGIDLLIEGLSTILNIPKNKLQEYYDDSRAFRDYLNNLADTLRLEARDDLLNVTPSTQPRFDVPWMTEELKKKQNELFEIKNQITEIQTKARETENKTYKEAFKEEIAKKGNPLLNATAGFVADISKPLFNSQFKKNKKKKIQHYNEQTVKLINKSQQVAKRPLVNNNPTYQSIQQRRKNAQSEKTANEKQK